MTVEVKSYREAKPLPGDAQPTAQGLASGVNIVRSQIASVTLTMASLSEPQISGISQNVGKVGDAIILSGVNLAPGNAIVTFNGTTAQVTQAKADRLDVEVPQGATVGPIRLSIGNQQSPPVRSIWSSSERITGRRWSAIRSMCSGEAARATSPAWSGPSWAPTVRWGLSRPSR